MTGPAPRPIGTLTVPRRFRGPSWSGNGGWTAGALAGFLPAGGAGAGAVRVRLSAPPPLDVPMDVVALAAGGTGGGAVRAVHGERPILEATAADPADTRCAALEEAVVGWAQAERAAAAYPGATGHPFPECFACGPDRAPGDGLRLAPGPVAGSPGVVAAPWRPDGDAADGAGVGVPLPLVWAALDCPGGWSVDIVGRPMVLGTITAAVLRTPGAGERCVVTGTAVEVGGRKARTATLLRGGTGEVLARATQVWIAVDPAGFGTP